MRCYISAACIAIDRGTQHKFRRCPSRCTLENPCAILAVPYPEACSRVPEFHCTMKVKNLVRLSVLSAVLSVCAAAPARAQFSPRSLEDPATGEQFHVCLLYTSDAADERSSVDLGGRR